MNTIQAPRVRPAYATALLVFLGLTWFSAPASAQGSLIVDLTSPTSGSTVSGTIPVNANVTIIGFLTVRGVQFKLDGANLGAEDTSAPYSVPWDTRTASNGSHTLVAVARDALGVLWNSSPVTVTVFNDTTPPSVAVTSPSPGAFVKGAIAVNAAASDNVAVVGVQFRLDGANLGAEDTASPYSVSWSTTTATDGSHILTAVARDAAGNTTTSGAVTVTVDNSAPTVALTAPTGGAIVAGTTTVTATASDNAGVAGVRFFVDGAAIGVEDTTAPYAVAWNTATVANGLRILTAVARDAAGNATTSGAVTVTVDNSAPAVALTAPTGGATVAGTTTVTAGASDNVGVIGVRFFVDGAAIGVEDTTSPYSVSWNTTSVANGSHSLTAVARDAAGNTTTSAGVTVTVANDTTPPSVSITAPAGGATVSGTLTVAANASDNVAVGGVQFKLDGANLGAEDTTSPYSVSWNTTSVANGSHSLTAVAHDAAGNTTTSAGVTVTVANDTTPPSVSITAPAGGATVSGTLTVAANASDNVAVGGVQFKVDGANLGAEDTTDPYSVAWDTTTVANGSHTLTAAARDAAGNTTTSSGVTVTVGNSALTVALTAPTGGVMVAGTTTVTAAASDDAVGVQFFVDGAAIGVEDTASPYSVAWDTTTVANGSHTLTAVARGAAANTETSAPVIVTVSQTATRFENTELSITYTEGTPAPERPPDWWHGSRSRGWSGGIASFNRSEGARARFHFTGTTVGWIGFRAPWAGIARVYLDDAFVAELDLYAPTEQVQAVVFSRSGLPDGSHTLTVESTGRKNDASQDYAVVVDAFDVAPASAVPTTGTRVEDDDDLSFSAGWAADAQALRTWSGATAEVSTTPGAQATLSFVGTEVRWVGLRGPQTGIARLFLDGSFHAEVDTYAPAEVETVVFTTTGLAAGRHTLTIEVTGNRNPAATNSLIAVDALDVRARVEDPDPSIAYTAGWQGQGIARAWSGSAPSPGTGSALFSRTAGVQATITFTGTSVSWIGFRAPWTGIARVSVDGGVAAEVDTYAPTEEVQAEVFSATGLADGPHTLTIEVTGQKNPSSGDSLVIVDAFDVTLSSSAPAITRFQETDPPTTYTGAWTQGTRLSFWSGETAAFSGTAGAHATFTFTGTAVRWIGNRSLAGGIARVLLDGVEVAVVDTFAPVQEDFQAAVYTAAGLANTTHTLTIEVTGQKNASSSNNWIFVDGFDVHQ